jgi:O-methyltransferase
MSGTQSIRGQLRRLVVRGLQATGLNVVASDFYYRRLHGFRPASTGLDEGFERIFARAAESGILREAPIYCEFGLFKGYSFWKAQDLANRHGLSAVRFYGFDSFEGLPEIEGLDQAAGAEFRQGQYACDLESVKKHLDTAGGVDWSRTQLIKGFFSETLKPERASTYGIGTVGIAMIDCDLYESTVDVLKFLEGRLRDGTILVMDDWNCFRGDDSYGQRRALRDLLARRPDMWIETLCTYGANSEAFTLRIKA